MCGTAVEKSIDWLVCLPECGLEFRSRRGQDAKESLTNHAVEKTPPRRSLAKGRIAVACACAAGCDRPHPATETVAEPTPKPRPAFSPTLSSRPPESRMAAEFKPVSGLMADLETAGSDEAKAALAAAYSARLTRDELVKNIRDLQAQPGSNQDVVLRAMLKQLAAQSPSLALQLAMEKDPRADNDGVARMVAEQWAATDYAGLYDYSRTLESGRMKYRMGSFAVEAWSARDPAAAFDYFSGLTFQDGGGLIGIAARELAKKDPNAALEALDTVKNEQIWDMAAGRIADVIARQAPDQAVDLLFDQTDPKAAAPMAGAIAAVLAESSVTDTIGILNKIENGNVAQNFLFGMLRSVNPGNMAEFTANFSQIADRESEPPRRGAWPAVSPGKIRAGSGLGCLAGPGRQKSGAGLCRTGQRLCGE